jgi:hypothetical protein
LVCCHEERWAIGRAIRIKTSAEIALSRLALTLSDRKSGFTQANARCVHFEKCTVRVSMETHWKSALGAGAVFSGFCRVDEFCIEFLVMVTFD